MNLRQIIAKSTTFKGSTLAAAGLLLSLIALYFLKAIASPSKIIYSAHSDLIMYISKVHFIQYISWLYHNQVPLWNSYSLLGNSMVGNSISWIFYPFNLAYYFTSSPFPVTISFMLHFFLLGFFTFLYVRKISGSTTAAIFSAVAMTFSGRILLLLYGGQVFFLGFAYFPLFLYLTELIIERKKLAYALPLGLALALQFLGTHIQMFFYSVFVLGMYVAFRLLPEFLKGHDAKNAAKGALMICVALAVFFLISSFQLLPFIETAGISDRGTADKSFASSYRFRLASLPTAVLPNLLGTPLHDTQFGPPNYVEQNIYFGLTALILAGLAVMYKRNKYTAFFAFLAAFSLFFSLAYMNQLPGFNLFRVASRMFFFGAFAVAVLCGYGALHLSRSSLRNVKAVYILPILLVAAILVTAGFSTAMGKQKATSFLEDTINSKLEAAQISKETADRYTGKLGVIYKDIRSDLAKATLFLALNTILLFAILRAERRMLKTALLAALLVLMLADLWSFGQPFFSVTHPSEAFMQDEFIPIMEADKDRETFRVIDFSNTSAVYQNTALRHGINVVSYDSQNLNTVARYMAIAFNTNLTNYNIETTLQPGAITNPSLINIINVKYILSSITANMTTDKQTGKLNTALVAKTGIKALYKNLDYKEKAFMAYHAETAQNEDEAFQRLRDSTTDFSRTIIIETAEAAKDEKLQQLTRKENETAQTNTVRITRNAPNTIDIEAETARLGLLFLSEPFAPGWTATVDGQKAQLYKANGAFMAVPVREGNHTVKFNYAPSSFYFGAAITAATMAAITAYYMAKLLGLLRPRKRENA